MTSKGVRALLRDYHALVSRQYDGDYDAIDILVDLADAIKRAELTGRQALALYYVFIEDLTQEEAGKRMDATKQTVNRLVNVGLAKISRKGRIDG